MREIVLDTETTGMEPSEGHRIIEIGCLELMNYVPTGNTYHQYINPERDVPAGAVAVHGLTEEILKDEPVFSQIYTDFLDFIGDGQLVIHNAVFDMKFINAELIKVGHAPLPMKQATDSLRIAREKFPGSPASLDALCRRFNIDLSGRDFHGALLDSELLAEVWLELMGGRQHGLGLGQEKSGGVDAALTVAQKEKQFRAPRPHEASAEEQDIHAKLLGQLTDPIWKES